jgi:carbamoyltransferase
MIVILGINKDHSDSSACLLIDGKLIGAVAEERLGNRIKHDSSFPVNSIKWLIKSAGLKYSDIDIIAISNNTLSNLPYKFLHSFDFSSLNLLKKIKNKIFNKSSIQQEIQKLALESNENKNNLKYKIYKVEHHLAHIASAYYLSKFEDVTAALSYDGSGDAVSLMLAKCQGTTIEVLERVYLPKSLGHFYSSICNFIGFDKFGEEFKVMGLSAYGEDKYSDYFNKLISYDEKNCFNQKNIFDYNSIDYKKNNSIKVNKNFFYNKKVEKFSQDSMDIAKSLQVAFEKIVLKIIERLHKKVPSNNLVMAGGCAMNGLVNGKIFKETNFKNHFIQPASTDDGTSLGAAYYCWHNLLKKKERFIMKHAFWGPIYGEDIILKSIKEKNLNYKKLTDIGELTQVAAKHIADGNVVGWYQGRSEWGARALGNRSILANPANKNMKNIINSKIKKRESFRPFAPSVMDEDVNRFFECNINSEFMNHIIKFKEEWRETFPSVCHVDSTARLQTVNKENNPLFYRLILELKKITGYGIILNTSFNENEPIVDTPAQAIDCFLRTDMDRLFLEKFVINKNFNDSHK